MIADRSMIVDVLRSGAAYVSELVAKIINRIVMMMPLVTAVGCQGPTVTPNADVDHKPAVSIPQPAPRQSADEPKPLGQFTITFYYVIGEEEILAKQGRERQRRSRHGQRETSWRPRRPTR